MPFEQQRKNMAFFLLAVLFLANFAVRGQQLRGGRGGGGPRGIRIGNKRNGLLIIPFSSPGGRNNKNNNRKTFVQKLGGGGGMMMIPHRFFSLPGPPSRRPRRGRRRGHRRHGGRRRVGRPNNRWGQGGINLFLINGANRRKRKQSKHARQQQQQQQEQQVLTARSESPSKPQANVSETVPVHFREFQSRIIGGTSASAGEYPFFISWNAECGASLIHSDIALTAAHCGGIQSDFVTISAYEIDSATAGGAEQKTIVQRVAHPNYNDDTSAYDFMVLKLDSDARARPIAINKDKSRPETNDELTVIGFGTTSESGPQPDILQEVVVPAVSHNKCSNNYGGGIEQDIMLCAGYTAGGRDSCQGDSGGPIFEFDNGVPRQVGVVSFGEGCAQPNRPGVYARVSGVSAWLEEQICSLSANPPSTCGGPPAPAPAPVPSPMPFEGPEPMQPDDQDEFVVGDDGFVTDDQFITTGDDWWINVGGFHDDGFYNDDGSQGGTDDWYSNGDDYHDDWF